jgi:uncharacterized protein (TIGR03437 family)
MNIENRLCRTLLVFAILAVPVLAFDGSTIAGLNPTGQAPPVRRTGNPADDNGATCMVCHGGAAVNSGLGHLVIRALPYTPGAKQIVEVDIRDPNASKWGFQLTARLASDPTKEAGTFTANDSIRVRCGPAGATYAPCGDEIEFASHSFASTEPGLRGGKTFQIEWTAPATDVGQVVFYAAGNAANNNTTNTGDMIYSTTHRIGTSACALAGPAQITMGSIGNAADFRTTLVPNALISVFGSGFAAAGSQRPVTPNDLLGGRVPNELGCLTLEIDGRRAPIFFVGAGQVNAQVPADVTVGRVPVRVVLNSGRANEVRSATTMVDIARSSPAFFTFDGKTIAGLNNTTGGQILANPSVVPGGVFARPGDVVSLYGTGFGSTDPASATGEFGSGRLRDALTVTVGTTTLDAADVIYAGLSPDAPGFCQISIRLPMTVADGNTVVRVQTGGASTQADATIPVRR